MEQFEQILQHLLREGAGDATAITEIRRLAVTQGVTGEALHGAVRAAGTRAGLSDARCAALLDALDTYDGAAPVDDSQTIVSPVASGDEATRVAIGPGPDDDATRVVAAQGASAPEQAPTEFFKPTPTTNASWSHPERWQPAHDAPIEAGSVIKERFVLEERIGRGGMGSVYRARDLRKEEAQDQETDVAIKLINEDFQAHPDAMVALQREAKKAQALAHPNIVTVYDFDRDGATVYLSMAYLRGEPLDRLIAKRVSGLPLKEALDIVLQMARGLAYAHEKGFAHADFKPGNVFLTDRGEVKILDFGIARAAAKAASGGDDTRFDPTSLGAITPAYASAEMLEGQAPETVDDVYALACVAYELVTGRHPFRDAQGHKLPANEAERQGLRVAPVKQLPKRYRRAIARGLAWRRADRFADAAAFLEALKSPAKTRRSILAGVVLLAVVAGASWWITYRQSDIAVTVSNLPPALRDSKSLIHSGDHSLEQNNFEEAHKDYAQAWEEGRNDPNVSARERSRLKVVVDRRVDRVIGHYLKMAQRNDLSTFSLEVLRLNLGALEKSELGNRDKDINATLTQLDKKLKDAP